LFVCLSVLHITVSLLRLYFDLCLFSCLFTLIVVFVIYCFVLPIVANKDLQKQLFNGLVCARQPGRVHI